MGVSDRTRPEGISIRLPAVPAVASLVRERFRHWLGSARWPEGELDDVVLAVNEAVANSVEHGYAGREPGDVEVVADLVTSRDGRHLQVTVRDRGRWRPPPADAGYRGRGLVVMHACMARVEVRPGPAGTEVRMTSTPVPNPPLTAPLPVFTVDLSRYPDHG